MKKLFLTLAILVVAGAILFLIVDEPIPKGEKGREAEALADKMLEAINQQAWDTTEYISWSTRNGHDFQWNKLEDKALIRWDNILVAMELKTLRSLVYKNGKPVDGKKKTKLHKKAWEFWCNDSFWLNAPAKIRDPGTERYLVSMENGNDALLVSYSSGGATPGDSYLWILDENYLPQSYKMWVSIIPVGGVEATWEGWESIHSGALIATTHQLGPLEIPTANLLSGKNAASINWEEKWFTP